MANPNEIIDSLKKTKYFIDLHSKDKEPINKWYFCILDSGDVCPLYKKYVCSITPLFIDTDMIPKLSRFALGVTLFPSIENIKEYNERYIEFEKTHYGDIIHQDIVTKVLEWNGDDFDVIFQYN